MNGYSNHLDKKYTRLDCLRGRFSEPASRREGLLFRTLFALTMAVAPCVNMAPIVCLCGTAFGIYMSGAPGVRS